MRIGLAFRAFFAILFGKPVPLEGLLPETPGELPERTDSTPADEGKDLGELERRLAAQDEEIAQLKAELESKKGDADQANAAAVQVLSVLQAEGRLLDFLSEDIDGFGDADVGAAVRDVHRGLRKALSDHFPVTHVREEDEDALVTVPAGFSATEIRLVGNVVGEPPFSGTLKHRGWKVQSVNLPRLRSGDEAKIVTPAEVEL